MSDCIHMHMYTLTWSKNITLKCAYCVGIIMRTNKLHFQNSECICAITLLIWITVLITVPFTGLPNALGGYDETPEVMSFLLKVSRQNTCIFVL